MATSEHPSLPGIRIPVVWRLRKQRYSLVGEICTHCGAKTPRPRDVCVSCNGEASTPHTFSRRGDAYNSTLLYIEPGSNGNGHHPERIEEIKLQIKAKVLTSR